MCSVSERSLKLQGEATCPVLGPSWQEKQEGLESVQGWEQSSATPGAAEGAGEAQHGEKEAQGAPPGSVPLHFYPTAAQVLGTGACNYYKPISIKGNCLFLSPVKTVNVFKALNVNLQLL